MVRFHQATVYIISRCYSFVCVCMCVLKPGFHYPSWRSELTARVDGWPVSITRQHGPCWWVMETGHPSTRAVNLGSGNRA